jgi:hypothetical protein
VKNTISFLFYLCLANLLIAQGFHFPDSDAIWSVYNEKYYIEGDSMVNSKTYKKIYFSSDSNLNNGILFALFREDTTSRQVFAIRADSTSEYLLYDFSLNVNDTASVYPTSFPYYSGPISISIDQIDSIMINGQYRKRFFIRGVQHNSNIPEYWIEGIGSTFGILNSGITGVTIFDIAYPTLLCFEQDGSLLYQNPAFTDCFEPYPIGISENKLQALQIFPNPAKNALTVRSEEAVIEYKIFSSLGQIVGGDDVNSMSFSFNVSNYQQGMYFLHLKTKDGVVIKKILKY